MGLTCFKSWKHDSTGQKGNRDVLASPGSYFFLSNSCGQGEEWLKSLNKGVWIPFTGVFGQRLEETVLYERRYGVRLVPLVVEQCVGFIRERGLHEVGLFRQSGQATLVKELQEAFDAGERPSFDSSTDVHTVASLLKLYLRQLPEPLVPYGRYQDFLFCGKKLASDRSQGLIELRTLLHDLPVANFNLLNYICQFLNEVQSYSSSNKMSCQNLATVFGPNILRAKAEDPHSIIGGAAVVQLLMLELIREHESLFSRPPPPCTTHPPGGRHASPGAPRQPQLNPSPCFRQLSLPLITERRGRGGSVSSCRDIGHPAHPASEHHSHSCMSAADSGLSVGQKRPLGHRYTSSHPENCFYALPSTSYPLPQHHAGRHSAAQQDYQRHAGLASSKAAAFPLTPQTPPTAFREEDPQADCSKPRLVVLGWAEARPNLAEAGACFWSSVTRGVAEEGAVPVAARRGSSEAQEDSTLSVYDNLDRASLQQRMEDVTGGHFEATAAGSCLGTSLGVVAGVVLEEAGQMAESSSSWSSCDILPLDESSCQDEEEEDFHPANSPASCSGPSDAALSTGSSEVFLPSAPSDLQGAQPQPEPQDVHSLLADLQKQMAKQKTDYQARINRLERCNDALQGQVAVLRASLEQQKRWHSVAEIKIRNVERARADADRRNATLQREMEQFFHMFGEISGEGETKRERSIQSF
ncbi:rho GTPase-activating protein 24-like [Polymixia lowei]